MSVFCFIRFIANRFLMKPTVRGEDVEWGYAFDVHLNAYFPSLVILHVVQLFFYHGKMEHFDMNNLMC